MFSKFLSVLSTVSLLSLVSACATDSSTMAAHNHAALQEHAAMDNKNMEDGKMDHGAMAGMDHEHVNMSAGEHAKHTGMMKDAKRHKYTVSQEAYKLPELDLVRMDGEEVDLSKEVAGDKPVVLNFIFTTCTTICPVLSATMAEFQDKLGDKAQDLKMISISIDPENDSTSALRAYAKKFDAGPQWQFYTGSLTQSENAQKAFDAFRGGKMNHIPLTFIKVPHHDKWTRIDGFTGASELLELYEESLGS